jgi:hypothetical protein
MMERVGSQPLLGPERADWPWDIFLLRVFG